MLENAKLGFKITSMHYLQAIASNFKHEKGNISIKVF